MELPKLIIDYPGCPYLRTIDGIPIAKVYHPRDAVELARRSNLFPKLVAEAAMLVATLKAHNIESVSCDNDGQQWCDCVHEQIDKLDALLAEARQQKGVAHDPE